MPEPFLAAILGGAVGVVGTLMAQGWRNSHERTMAREARLLEHRAIAYNLILTRAFTIALWVERTGRLFKGSEPTPPLETLPDAELAALNAAITEHASPRAQELSRALEERARAFGWAAEDVEREERHPSDRSREIREAQDAARLAFLDALKELGDRANKELRGEVPKE